MYFFVRFQGFLSLVFGILLMFLGIGVMIYGFVQNVALVDIVNSYRLFDWLYGPGTRVLDVRFFAFVICLVLFLVGLCIAACGQLLLVFADVAENTRETRHILRGIRNSQRNAVAPSPDVPVSNTSPVVEPSAVAQSVDLPPAS